MLILRKKQMNALGQIPRISFENKLISYFSETYPDECGLIGRDAVRKIIQYGIKRAESHEFTTQKQVTYYISLMFILGSDFDKDIQLPWIIEQIDDRAIFDLTRRIERCYDSTLTYLGEIGGDNNRYLVKAIIRSRSFALDSVPQSTGEKFVQDTVNIFNYLYPQKCVYQGTDVLSKMVLQGIKDAAEYGISRNKGVFVYILCMFYLGSFFYCDRLFPWAQKILTDSTITDGKTKADLLYQALFNYSKIGL